MISTKSKSKKKTTSWESKLPYPRRMTIYKFEKMLLEKEELEPSEYDARLHEIIERLKI